MSKKDYIIIEKSLAKSNYVLEPNTNIQAYGIYREICENLAQTLQKTNPRFDREKFLIACGFTN